MALHNEPAILSVEVIEEFLLAAEISLHLRKPDGGCLGYSATLQLFCIVDAMGRYLALDQRSEMKKGEPFHVLRLYFGLDLQTEQIKRLEWWYRNGLAHNAALPQGTCLSEEDGEPFEFAANGEPVKIRVYSFHRLVQQGWDRFDRSLIQPTRCLHPRKSPAIGFESSGASSGCPLSTSVTGQDGLQL